MYLPYRWSSVLETGSRNVHQYGAQAPRMKETCRCCLCACAWWVPHAIAAATAATPCHCRGLRPTPSGSRPYQYPRWWTPQVLGTASQQHSWWGSCRAWGLLRCCAGPLLQPAYVFSEPVPCLACRSAGRWKRFCDCDRVQEGRVHRCSESEQAAQKHVNK